MFYISIPYFSGAGHTHKLASTIGRGAEELSDVKVSLIDVENVDQQDWEALEQSQGIILGTPTYMGSMAARYKMFLEETASAFWLEQRWTDKIAGGFTIGSAPSGDKLNTLIALATFAAEQGMVWAGFNHIGSRYSNDGLGINHDGSWLGLMATSDTDKSRLIRPRDEVSAKLFGRRIAEAVKRWGASSACS